MLIETTASSMRPHKMATDPATYDDEDEIM
jgi:hypothetical protein